MAKKEREKTDRIRVTLRESVSVEIRKEAALAKKSISRVVQEHLIRSLGIDSQEESLDPEELAIAS